MRAIGIVRVSETRGREGVSPRDQAERIRAECERRGWRLVDTVEELDVSGRTPLARRRGLRAAVEAIEAGDANIIMVAYFDRLMRSTKVQAEVAERVEAAGGDVFTLDVGKVTNGNAAQKLTTNFLAAVAQYHADVTGEKAAAAQADAVERGVAPWPNVLPGYVRGEDGSFEIDPTTAPTVREVFRMRAAGAAIPACRDFLRERGIDRSIGSVTRLFGKRAYLGEIHFGKLVNLNAHDAIVDRDTFDRVQRVRVSRGRLAKSERLLARLGVLHCGTCGARLVASSQRQHGGPYAFYRCAGPDCAHKVTVGAELAERVVVDAVKAAIADIEGQASAEHAHAQAAERVERARAAFDAAIKAFDGFDAASVREKLQELRADIDEAEDHLHRLGGPRHAVVVTADDWGRLTLEERRAVIRATVLRATVAAGGRGAGRVTVELLSE
jgi:DNA invertase Pin-like site-specific DNA recombinase